MSFNLTSTFLTAKRQLVLPMFARAVNTNSVGLNGPGGANSDGYPVPLRGRVLALSVYDGSTVRTSWQTIELSPNDRISVYATWANPTFTVSLLINNVTTLLQVSNCSANTTLQASLLIQLEAE